MANYRVTCINKKDRYSQHEGITHLGSYDWWMSRAEVVRYIEMGIHTFYTENNGRRAALVVRSGPYGKYVQTVADGYYTNNLLELNECAIA